MQRGASLAIIIVNFRTPAVTADCLRSLIASEKEMANTLVVVVENGSGDASGNLLNCDIETLGWQQRVKLLRLERNLGFAGGNNLGLRWVLKQEPEIQYVLLLNSDTIVPSGVLTACKRVMDTDQGIGMMSCRLVSADGSVQNVTRGFPSPLRQTVCALGLPWRWPKIFGWANFYDATAQIDEPRDCDWIGGAFMYIRRSAIDKVGLLDDSFFFYGEDIEYCHRFRRAGYRVHYDPATSITHLGGVSSDPTRFAATARNRRMWQARYLVQERCYGRLAAWWIRLVDIAVYASRKVVLWCLGRRADGKYREACDVLTLLLRKLDADS